MQVLDYSNDKSISTWQDESGSYIRGFLISTKTNKNNWKISQCSKDRVNNFIGKDFAVIPNRIGNRSLLDGHVTGSKEGVLKAYSDNSYGKIQKVLGPFEYKDGSGDLYWEHITKLHNDKVASALMQHGAGTLVKFATSPHIFAYEGNDETGWTGWEPAGIVLVNNPAFGEQSIITKKCMGQQEVCTAALSQENKIAAIVNCISSLVNSSDSNGYRMSNNDTTNAVAEDLNKATNTLSENSLQVQETKQPVTQPTNQTIITDEIKPTTSQAEQQQSEEVKILKQKIADMENEKKEEILNGMLSVLSDEKERDRLIKEMSKANDLNTIKYLKGLVDMLAPLHRKAGESEATKAFKAEQEKELATFKKNKIASTNNYKFQLPGEPKEPEKIEGEDNKIASTRKVGEIAELQSLLKGWAK